MLEPAASLPVPRQVQLAARRLAHAAVQARRNPQVRCRSPQPPWTTRTLSAGMSQGMPSRGPAGEAGSDTRLRGAVPLSRYRWDGALLRLVGPFARPPPRLQRGQGQQQWMSERLWCVGLVIGPLRAVVRRLLRLLNIPGLAVVPGVYGAPPVPP